MEDSYCRDNNSSGRKIMFNKNKLAGDFPWCSRGKKIHLPIQRMRVQSLVREPRSHMPWATEAVFHNEDATQPNK